jgi:hypothetical protein
MSKRSWKHDPWSPQLSEGEWWKLASLEPEHPPEPTASQALRLGSDASRRIRAAIGRPSGPRGQAAAEAILRQRGAGTLAEPAQMSESWEGFVPSGRVAARICRPSGPEKEREGVA